MSEKPIDLESGNNVAFEYDWRETIPHTRDADGYYVRLDGVRFADPEGRLIVQLPKRLRSETPEP